MSPRPEARATTLEQLFATKEIVVFCGSGGVGKTSVAAAAALGASVRLGGKTLVLTIDPAAPPRDRARSRRHRQRGAPGAVRAAEGGRHRAARRALGRDARHQAVVGRPRAAATRKDEATAHRILENRLYHNITARFVQSHDYIAMERLFEIHASGEYDLIVIDTPPTRNAVDFLDAPARMSDFFGGRLLRWLTLPYRVGGKRSTRVINMASRPFYQLADRVLGSKFLEDIAEFFLNFQSMYDGVRRARAVGRAAAARPPHDVRGRHHARSGAAVRGRAVLRDAARPELPPRRAGAEQDAARHAARPDGARGRDAVRRPGRPARRRAGGAARSRAGRSRRAPRRVLRTIGESFANFSVVAMREAELRAELARRARRRRARARLRARHQRRRGARRDLPRAVRRLVTHASRYHRRVSTLDDLARLRTRLGGADLVHLERLVAAWRPLADLSFADLVLLAPIAGEEGHRFVVLAQVRPVTGPDRTTRKTSSAPSSTRSSARCSRGRWRAGESVEADTHAIGAKERVRVQCIPVRRGGRLIGLADPRSRRRRSPRRTGELERTYLETFQRFAQMIADGSFPFDLDEIEIESAPRVGDGVILIDGETRVKFASPNAVSLLHRLGIHTYAQRAYLADIGFDDDAGARRDAPASPGRDRDRARRRLDVPAGAARCSRTTSRPARSCSCATSPTSGAATGCCSRRTRRSARSTTG